MPGNNTYNTPTNVTLNCNARYVALYYGSGSTVADVTSGYAGLSAVQFNSVVPEPGTMALLVSWSDCSATPGEGGVSKVVAPKGCEFS